ncbi:hypothetical protein SLS62_009704 [Diatrype stigma]|uniref:Uncharacterized protein n=1 Tax=Diatrype stigma TaxID=117547 RepID=A0AAN9UDI9_9PEZI
MDATAFNIYFETLPRDNKQWRPVERAVKFASREDTSKFVHNSVLYMPYLHWGYIEDLVRPVDRTKHVHDRRTLDEAGFSYPTAKDLEKRSQNQVVTKYFAPAKKRGKTHLMVVDQLWFWTLADSLLVTSFPDSPETEQCVDRSSDLRVLDKNLDENPQGSQTLRPKDVLSLQHDKDAIGLVRDIIEELQVMIRITQLQQRALKSAHHRHWYIWESNLGDSMQTLEALSQQAKDIHEMLMSTLQIKQTQISMRQNEIVVAFTIVTIIFLPLGFFSSIFGMNASELSEGSPMGLRSIFAIMCK